MKLKIDNIRTYSNLSFTNRIAPMWNSLPDSVVSDNTIDTLRFA